MINTDLNVGAQQSDLNADNLPVAFYCKNKHGVYTKCNKFFLQALQLESVEDVAGKTDYAFLPENLASVISNNDKITMKNGVLCSFEEEFLDKSGNSKIFINQRKPVYDANTNIVGILGTLTEITNIKHSEQEAKHYLSSVLSIVPSHIFWMDKDGKIIGCNEQQAKTFGMTVEDLQGKNIFDVAKHLQWSKGIPEKIRENDLMIMSTGNDFTLEEKVLINGREKHYFTHKSPLYDSKKNVIGIIEPVPFEKKPINTGFFC